MSTASKWVVVILAAMATSAFAADTKVYKVPSPHGSGYTVLTGTGSCADVYYSGETRTPDFHVERINARDCRPGETDGHRNYYQTNPSGPGAGGMAR